MSPPDDEGRPGEEAANPSNPRPEDTPWLGMSPLDYADVDEAFLRILALRGLSDGALRLVLYVRLHDDSVPAYKDELIRRGMLP